MKRLTIQPKDELFFKDSEFWKHQIFLKNIVMQKINLWKIIYKTRERTEAKLSWDLFHFTLSKTAKLSEVLAFR